MQKRFCAFPCLLFLSSYPLAVPSLLALLVGLPFLCLLEKRTVLLSLMSLGGVFAFAFVAHAPMTCVLLGIFGANALLLQLVYQEENELKFQNSHKDDLSPSERFKVATRLSILGIGGAPLLSWLHLSFWNITISYGDPPSSSNKAALTSLIVLLMGIISLDFWGAKISLRSTKKT